MITNRDYDGDRAERRMGILHVRDKRHLCGTWGQRGNGICHPNCVVLGSLVTRFQDMALSGRYCHFDTVTIGRHSSSSIRTAEKQQPTQPTSDPGKSTPRWQHPKERWWGEATSLTRVLPACSLLLSTGGAGMAKLCYGYRTLGIS